MTTPQLERLTAHCERLRLHRVAADLSTVLEQAAKKDVSYADFLDDVLAREVAAKQEKHQAMRVMMARFPFQKTLESFDWKFQPSIEPKVIKELASGRFIADGENVLLLGPPGVGKTHLAVALGMSACALGLPDDVHHGGRADHDAGQGALQESAGGAAQGADPAQAADHRRDRLHPDRPAGGEPVLPADQPAL